MERSRGAADGDPEGLLEMFFTNGAHDEKKRVLAGTSRRPAVHPPSSLHATQAVQGNRTTARAGRTEVNRMRPKASSPEFMKAVQSHEVVEYGHGGGATGEDGRPDGVLGVTFSLSNCFVWPRHLRVSKVWNFQHSFFSRDLCSRMSSWPSAISTTLQLWR